MLGNGPFRSIAMIKPLSNEATYQTTCALYKIQKPFGTEQVLKCSNTAILTTEYQTMIYLPDLFCPESILKIPSNFIKHDTFPDPLATKPTNFSESYHHFITMDFIDGKNQWDENIAPGQSILINKAIASNPLYMESLGKLAILCALFQCDDSILCNVNSENVFLDKSGNITIIDFCVNSCEYNHFESGRKHPLASKLSESTMDEFNLLFSSEESEIHTGIDAVIADISIFLGGVKFSNSNKALIEKGIKTQLAQLKTTDPKKRILMDSLKSFLTEHGCFTGHLKTFF